jgi:hypothetical protein
MIPVPFGGVSQAPHPVPTAEGSHFPRPCPLSSVPSLPCAAIATPPRKDRGGLGRRDGVKRRAGSLVTPGARSLRLGVRSVLDAGTGPVTWVWEAPRAPEPPGPPGDGQWRCLAPLRSCVVSVSHLSEISQRAKIRGPRFAGSRACRPPHSQACSRVFSAESLWDWWAGLLVHSGLGTSRLVLAVLGET